MSFIELVAETELGSGYVSELERGLVVPGIGALARIASALNVGLCDLVAFPEDSVRSQILDVLRRTSELEQLRILADAERCAQPPADPK